MQEFRKITSKPVVAVIYSHFHHDHIDGVKGLVSEEQVKTPHFTELALHFL